MGTTPQNNSFVTIAEQVSLLNQNSVEIITKMNDVVTSTNSSVNVIQYDSNGDQYSYSLPTIGKLQSEITELNNNVNRLSGMNDNNVHIINGNSTKKIYLSDLNREPNKIDSIDYVSTFNQSNNWFFESLMNPTLSIKFDLTDKIGNDVDGVLSRRYIVKFERDSNGIYTNRGESSRVDFVNKFVGKKNINYSDFIDWHTNSTNLGVVTNLTPIYDEQYFNFEYQEVSDHGIFSVMKQELDTINNKLWFHIYPYKYTTSTGSEKIIKIGNELILNKQDSVTRWTVLETSESNSNFRVRLERIEGFDPIPTGTNVLKYYGSTVVNKNVKVTIGFDEHLVVFMKPTNSKNRIKGSLWSTGTGIYTNDLKLDTDSNKSMSQYYLESVSDYGNLIRDMIKKSIPSNYGVEPDAPILDVNNFKVVQINKHLTDTNDSKKINDLHQQKNSIKTKLEQINNAIIQKNQDLSIKVYSSISDKTTSQNELNKLISDQESYSKNLNSITTQIKSQTDTVNKVSPKFKIRGFWNIPNGKEQSGYRTQEIVQFKIQYRYSSKNGTENQTEGYNLTDSSNVTKTAYFSNWTPILSDLRKRTYDETTQTWTWLVENVSDADTPNINQLDISINAGEKVEIRVQSISEVGYPDSILESVWSNILTIDFPDNLNSIIDENKFILDEAQSDNIVSQFNLTLDSKGVNKHTQESYYINESYVAHNDDKIVTNYKDTVGNNYNLREYLDYLTNKISKLEGIIYSSKGILKVSIFNGINQIEIKNNSELNLSVVLENYGITKDKINYDNKVGIIKDFYLKFENLSSAAGLSFLVRDSYTLGTIIRQNSSSDLVSLVDTNNNFVIQTDNQYVYFCDTYNNTNLYDGDLLNNSDVTENLLISAIESDNKNMGLNSGYTNLSKNNIVVYPATGKFSDDYINDWKNGVGVMGTLVAPQVKTINDLISPNGTSLEITNDEDIIIPINIYWIFKTNDTINSSINLSTEQLMEHNKSLRVRLNPSTISTPFDFIVNFNIQNKKI